MVCAPLEAAHLLPVSLETALRLERWRSGVALQDHPIATPRRQLVGIPRQRTWRQGGTADPLWFANRRCTLTKVLVFHCRNRLSSLHTYPLEPCGLRGQRASFLLLHPIFEHSLYESPRPPGFPNNREHTLNITPPKEKPARTENGF